MMLTVDGAAVAAAPGETVLAVLRRANPGIMTVCGGKGVCGTCRVAVPEGWAGRLPAPAKQETRVLAALKGGLCHRLACQLTLAPEHDGLAVRHDPPSWATKQPSKGQDR